MCSSGRMHTKTTPISPYDSVSEVLRTGLGLVSAFVLPRLGYCNSILSGWSQYHLNRLQKIQNNAARFILKDSETDHITPHLRTLHWLPFDATIKYKLCSLCFRAITSTGPVDLSDVLKIYTHSRQLQYSADIRIPCIPTVNAGSYGEFCFSYSVRSNTLEHTSNRHKVFSVSFFL